MENRTPSPARLREIAEHVRSLAAYTQAEEIALAADEIERLRADMLELTCGDPRRVCPNCRESAVSASAESEK